MFRVTWVVLTVASFLEPLHAAIPDRDFSGTWLLDRAAGNFRQLSPPAETLSIRQTESLIDVTAGPSRWTFPLDGEDRKYQVAGERWSSASKWEGSALLINSLVMGAQDYTVMDRWLLADGRQSLTITRQILLQGGTQTEGVLVYRRPGAAMTSVKPAQAPVLTRRPEAPRVTPEEREYVVPAGTRILLSLVNSVNTKHSHDGDRVYLEAAFPVVIDGRTVVPKGSTVTGTVSKAKRPGKVVGKGELYIRFDQMTLPNGVTRDFQSRLASADNGSGQVDRNEGTIKGSGDRGGDAKTVATGAGIGATIGGVAGRSVGTAGMGGAAGAAAGLATVLMKRGPDPSLPRGTQVEMVLDRELRYRAGELSR